MLAANNCRRDCVGDFCFAAYGAAGAFDDHPSSRLKPAQGAAPPEEPGELESTDGLAVKTTAYYGEGGFTKSLR